MEPIEASVDYSEDDFMRALDYVKRRSFLYRYAVWIAPLAMLAIVSLVTFSLRNKTDEGGLLGALLIAAIAAVIVGAAVFAATRVIDPWFAKRSIRKQIAASPLLQERNDIRFNETGIEGTTFLGGSATRWAGIIEAVETETDFHFFTGPRFSLFVPKRGFRNGDDIQHLRALLSEKLGNKVTLN